MNETLAWFLGSVPAWASKMMDEKRVAFKMEPARSSSSESPPSGPRLRSGQCWAGESAGLGLSPVCPADGHQPLPPHPGP